VTSLPYVSERTRSEFNYYLSQADEVIDTGPYPTHEVVRHYRFVSAVAGRTIRPEPPKIAWRDHPPPIPAGAPYAVLNPGSNEPGRRWPFAGYQSIARRLLGLGYRVAFVGQPGERGSGQGIGDMAADARVIDLTGRTDLFQLLDLINNAALTVTNDTGPAHLSIALGRPTVVIVGGGHFGSFVPYPPEATPANARFVFQKMECYHCFWRCHKRADKFQVFPCVDAVGEDQVWRACEALMAAIPAIPAKPGSGAPARRP
jgi:ADP-heptose:LPS heptosyltransferase